MIGCARRDQNAGGFRVGFAEKADVIRGLAPERALPAAPVQGLIAGVRHLEHLGDVDHCWR